MYPIPKSLPKSLIAAAVVLMICGCAISRTTSVQISGPPGELFTVHYRTGARSGTIRTVTQADQATGVLKLHTAEDDFSCELSKDDPDVPLIVEIRHRSEPVFRAEAPAGTRGIRIFRIANEWKDEKY